MNETLTLITQISIIPLIMIITAIVIILIKRGKNKILTNVEDEDIKVIVEVTEDSITDTIASASNAYIESLKDKNAFDKETQKEAIAAVKQEVSDTIQQEIIENLPTVTQSLANHMVNEILNDTKKEEE